VSHVSYIKEYTGHEEYTDKIPVKQGTVQHQYLSKEKGTKTNNSSKTPHRKLKIGQHEPLVTPVGLL
jgi:hypothetical protein